MGCRRKKKGISFNEHSLKDKIVSNFTLFNSANVYVRASIRKSSASPISKPTQTLGFQCASCDLLIIIPSSSFLPVVGLHSLTCQILMIAGGVLSLP